MFMWIMAFTLLHEMHVSSSSLVLLGRTKCLYNKCYEEQNYYTQVQKCTGQHRQYLFYIEFSQHNIK